MPSIKAQGLSFAYSSAALVLENVHWRIEQSEFWCISGNDRRRNGHASVLRIALLCCRPVNSPIIQIFGTKKCPDTRKAERWFKERGMKVQSIDLSQKGLSPGELKSVAARLGGMEALIDRESKRYVDKGLKYAAPTGARLEGLLLDEPELLRTPIVRRGKDATVGFQPEAWEAWR